MLDEADLKRLERPQQGPLADAFATMCKLIAPSEEAIARDLWECAHAGVCHSVYRYGTHANGGSYCREITQDVATRLGRLSLATWSLGTCGCSIR